MADLLEADIDGGNKGQGKADVFHRSNDDCNTAVNFFPTFSKASEN